MCILVVVGTATAFLHEYTVYHTKEPDKPIIEHSILFAELSS